MISRPLVHVAFTQVAYHPQSLVRPLHLIRRVITPQTSVRAEIVVRALASQALGMGSIYLSSPWAWPDSRLSYDETDAVWRKTCDAIASRLGELSGAAVAHPLELGQRMYESVCDHEMLVTELAIIPLADAVVVLKLV